VDLAAFGVARGVLHFAVLPDAVLSLELLCQFGLGCMGAVEELAVASDASNVAAPIKYRILMRGTVASRADQEFPLCVEGRWSTEDWNSRRGRTPACFPPIATFC
jgi:hypothetical protein